MIPLFHQKFFQLITTFSFFPSFALFVFAIIVVAAAISSKPIFRTDEHSVIELKPASLYFDMITVFILE